MIYAAAAGFVIGACMGGQHQDPANKIIDGLFMCAVAILNYGVLAWIFG